MRQNEIWGGGVEKAQWSERARWNVRLGGVRLKMNEKKEETIGLYFGFISKWTRFLT